MKRTLLTSFIICTAFMLHAKGPAALESPLSQTRAPLVFIENKGQITDQNKHARADIQFSLKAAPGLNIFIGPGTIHYQFSHADSAKTWNKTTLSKMGRMEQQAAERCTFNMHRMDVELQGSNPDAEVIKDEKQDYYENYVNAESGKELTASTYNRITYKNIYPHIDWVLYFKKGHLEHEFLIHEGGNPDNIRLKYGGSSSLKINSDGSLSAVTPLGSVTEQAPVSYQTNGARINSRYVLNGNIISYNIGTYKGNLVIDPGLDWATYFGGSNADYGFNVATDNSGNVYMTGYTLSLGLATTGAYDTIGNATYTCAFLAKFSAGGALLWSTYYGAYQSRCVTTDAANNVYIGCLIGGYGTLVKFNPNGAYQWAQSFGEIHANSTFVFGLATDKNSNVYVTGATQTADDIALGNTHQTTLAGQSNAYLIKYNSSGVKQWGTYYGGTGDEAGYGIAVDASGYIYISGSSTSSAGVATPGAYLTTNNGSFLAKFDTTGNLVWGTYYYGQSCWSVALDKTGGVYVCGTINAGAPGLSTPGAYQTAYGGGNEDGFLARFTTSGALSWATYFGGSDEDYGQGVATDNRGNVYLTGLTYSDSDIATPGAYSTAINGDRYDDAYLAQFNAAGNLLYATYFGGNGSDWGYSIAADVSSNIYMTGNTSSQYGLATSGAYDVLYNAGSGFATDAFLAKFQFCVGGNSGNIAGPANICAGDTIALTDTVPGGLWSISDTSIATINSAGKVIGLASGNVSVYYTFTNICNVAAYNLQVNAPPGGSINAEGATTFCQGDSVLLNAGGGAGLTYQWLLNGDILAGDTGVTISAREGGTYSVKISSTSSCGSTTLPGVAVTVNNAPAAIVTPQGPTTFCQGDSVKLTASTATSYHWSNNATTQSINVTQAGNYTVVVSNASNCSAISSATIVTVNSLPAATIAPGSATTFCQGDSVVLTAGAATSYLWSNNATTQSINVTQAGNYTVVVSNASNCSATSSATIVTVNSLPAATITPGSATTFCQGDSVVLTAGAATSYLWSNNATTQSIKVKQGGNYTVVVSNANNCSAISTATIVTVNSLPAATITPGSATTFCQGDSVKLTASAGISYRWSNNATTQSINVTQAGNYSVVVSNANNCSATSFATIVTVNSLPAATITPGSATTFCQGDSVTLVAGAASKYMWSNNATSQSIMVKSAGNYAVAVTNANNCSATSAITTITVHQPVATSISKNICAGQNYLGYNTPGLHIDTFYNASIYGCDSIRTLNLSIQSVITTSVAQELCPGANYFGYTNPGTYVDSFTANGGCDSIRTLTLTSLLPDTVTIAQTLCNGESYQGRDTPGIFVDTFYNASVNGCDSIRTLHLSVLQPVTSILSQSICAGQSYAGYNSAGTHIDTFYNASINGCDSIRTLNLLVLPPVTAATSQNICAGQNYLGYDTSGVYIDTLRNAAVNGCDSILTLNLTVQSVIITTITDSLCNGEKYYGHASSGIYVDSFSAVGGCDSVRTLNLTILNISQTSLNDSICVGSTFVLNGRTFTRSGDYSDTLQAQSGCDSIVTLHLFADSLPAPVISKVNDTLSIQAFASYQWLINDSAINLATAQNLVISKNGNYSVAVINASGCTDTSAVFNVIGLGIEGFAGAYGVKLYPNPNNGNFIFEFSDNKIREVEITDGIGRTIVSRVKVDKQKTFNLEGLSAGIYILYVNDGGERRNLKFSLVR